jgi:hypothetical protein
MEAPLALRMDFEAALRRAMPDVQILGGSADRLWNTVSVVDQGFGEFNVWKDALINPNVAVSSSTNLVGIDDRSGVFTAR